MTQVFSAKGNTIPVTVIEAGPCFVTQIKTVAHDSYNAVQIGFGQSKHLSKAEKGHLGDLGPLQHLHEVRTDDLERYQHGQQLDVSMFKVGDIVDVVATSKGKGFAGVVKRHGFHGGPKTHGASDRTRAPGAISSGTTPGRIFKGLRMAGHMGARRTTSQNLEVVLVDPERNLLAVKGAVPGAKNGLIFVQKARKQ